MTSFQRTGHRERLFFGTGTLGAGNPVVITGHEAAFALLRDLGRDPWGRTALRRLYVEATGRASICWQSDHAVLEGLARRLVTRELKAWSIPLPVVDVLMWADLPLEKPKPKPKPKPEKKVDYEVTFEVVDDAGNPVSGIAWSLCGPDGKEMDRGKLNDLGKVQKPKVQKGSYTLVLKMLSKPAEGLGAIEVDKKTKLRAGISGFNSGTAGVFDIFDATAVSGSPAVTVQGKVGADKVLVAEWTPTAAALGKITSGMVVITAAVGGTRATSPPVPVVRRHVIELSGPSGPLPDTAVIAHFSAGSTVEAACVGGRLEVLAPFGEALFWIDLPTIPGARITLDVEGEKREYETRSEGGVSE